MNFVWVDEGSDPDYAKAARHSASGLSLSIREATQASLAGLAQHGFKVGVYFAQNWYEAPTGSALADIVSAKIDELAPNTQPDYPRVCADIETHDVGYILDFLRRWRQLRPRRVTDWALEGFQGGLFSRDAVSRILSANVAVVPSNYTGDMRPWAADRVALDLVRAGFPESVLHGFYDGAALPLEWDGYVFTQGRLP